MERGSAYDLARKLKGRSGRAIATQEGSSKKGTRRPTATPKKGYRTPPKATSMAPNAKNKRKSYGRALPETAAEERKRKGKK